MTSEDHSRAGWPGLLLLDPLIHKVFEAVERQGSLSKHHVVELAHVKARTQLRASALAQPTSHHAVVVPTALGIWAWNGTKARLLRAPALDGTYGQQRDCAISEDGARAACISGGRAWVAQFPSP